MTERAFVPASQGDLVRVIKNGHPYLDELVEIEDFVSAEESDDGEAFYWASGGGGVNNIHDLTDGDFVPAYTAAEARARKPPTVSDVANSLHLTGDHDVFNCNETEVIDNIVTCYGETPDGLCIVVKLKVTDVQQVDW